MSLLEVNRIRFPSGETFGAESFPAVVSCLGSPPAVGTIHSFPSYSSLSSRGPCYFNAASPGIPGMSSFQSSTISPPRKAAWNAPGSRTWSIRQTPNANSRRSDAEPMAPPFAKLAYLYVGTSDFKRDLEYYTKVLGAEVLWNYNEFDANVAGLRLAEG